MNNNSYHAAGKAVLNWRKLSISMKAAYGRWKAESDASWETKFKVIVIHCQGRRLKQSPTYPFGDRQWAEECARWWRDNGCIAEVKEVQT